MSTDPMQSGRSYVVKRHYFIVFACFVLTHFLLHSSMQQSLTVLVPRVWPFLRHTISSVRRAALETLFTLLSKAEQVKLDNI